MAGRLSGIALHRTLLRRSRCSHRRGVLSSHEGDAVLSNTGLCARYFAAWASDNEQTPVAHAHATASGNAFAAAAQADEQLTHPQMIEAKPLTASNGKARNYNVLGEDALPSGRSNSFYNREVMEALGRGDLRHAMAITTTLRERFPSSKPVLTQPMYNLLLFRYCQRQRTLPNAHLQGMLALLDEMVAVGRVNSRSFHTALAACSRARDLRSAQRVVQVMQACGLEPGAFAYANLINCCARKRGRVNLADRFFREMLRDGFEPSVEVLNAMLRVYSRANGRSDRVLALVQRARDEFDVHPDHFTSRLVVHYLLGEGNVGHAVKFVQSLARSYRVAQEGCALPVQRHVLNALLDACRQCGDWDSAQDVLEFFPLTSQDGQPWSASSRRTAQVTTDLETLVDVRDSDAAPLAWSVADWESETMMPQQEKAFRLAVSRQQSAERAIESVQLTTEDASRSGGKPKPDGANPYVYSLRLERKMDVLESMISEENATPAMFNAVLSACGREGQLDLAKEVLDQMEHYAVAHPDCEPTMWSYNAVLNAYAVCGAASDASAFIDELMERGLKPDTVTMNTVLKAHVSALAEGVAGGQHARLEILTHAMNFYESCTEELGLVPDAATNFTLFRLFASDLRGDDDEVNGRLKKEDAKSNENEAENEEHDDGYDDMRETELREWMVDCIGSTCRDAPLEMLDLGVFNAAIDYFQQVGEVEQAFAIFNTLRDRGFEPDDNTMGLLFAACARAHKAAVGLKFLDHLMSDNTFRPSVNVLNGAILLNANTGRPQGALELFQAIQASDRYKVTADTYENVVHAYSYVGNVLDAWGFVDKMEQELGKVTVSAYNRVLHACIVSGLPDLGVEVLQHMKSKRGVEPDSTSYDNVFEAYVVAGQKALELDAEKDKDDDFEDEKKDVKDDKLDDLRSLRSPGDLDDGELLDAPPEPQETEIERQKRVRTSVLRLLDDIDAMGVKVNALTYRRAVAVCDVHRDPEGVVRVFDRLILRDGEEVKLNEELVSDESLAAYLFACKRFQDARRVDEMPELLHKWHVMTGKRPSLNVVLRLFGALESVGEWCRAMRLLPEMETLYGVMPNVVFFNRIMQICNRVGEHQLVAPIFSTMQDPAAYRLFPDVESYIQMIYAEEKRENWTAATNLFVEMQNKCPSEDITPRRLQQIELGRYRLRQEQHD